MWRWVHALAFPCEGCVTLGEPLNLSRLPFPPGLCFLPDAMRRFNWVKIHFINLRDEPVGIIVIMRPPVRAV